MAALAQEGVTLTLSKEKQLHVLKLLEMERWLLLDILARKREEGAPVVDEDEIAAAFDTNVELKRLVEGSSEELA